MFQVGMTSSEQQPAATHDTIRLDGLTVSRPQRSAVVAERAVNLTTAEFDLLWYLASNAGTVVSRDDLYRSVLKTEYDGLDRCIDLRISRLRRKLGDNAREPQLIKSVRSEGYILAADNEARSV